MTVFATYDQLFELFAIGAQPCFDPFGSLSGGLAQCELPQGASDSTEESVRWCRYLSGGASACFPAPITCISDGVVSTHLKLFSTRVRFRLVNSKRTGIETLKWVVEHAAAVTTAGELKFTEPHYAERSQQFSQFTHLERFWLQEPDLLRWERRYQGVRRTIGVMVEIPLCAMSELQESVSGSGGELNQESRQAVEIISYFMNSLHISNRLRM